MKRSIAMFVVACLAASAAAQDKVDLKLNLKQGQTYKLVMDMDNQITQKMMGQEQKISQNIVMGYTMDVKDIAADGTTTMEVKYDTVKVAMGMPMGKMEYDSTKPEPANMNPMMGAFAGIVGQTLTVKMTPRGKVTDVQGADKLMESVMKKINLPDEVKKQVGESMKQQFGPEAMKKSFEQMLGMYPEKPVAVGDTWDREMSVNMSMPIQAKMTYKLKEADASTATLDVNGTMTTDANTPVKMGQGTMTYNMKGEQQGTITLDRSSGWIKSAKMKQTIGGTNTMDAGGQKMEMPMDMNMTMTMEGK